MISIEIMTLSNIHYAFDSIFPLSSCLVDQRSIIAAVSQLEI
jgi:hypothetical protein